MRYTTGLTYKTNLNRDIAGILDKVGLVHMFEFSVDKQNHDCLSNLSSAVSGKASGGCSEFGTERDFYNEENGMLEAVATSTIKQKYSFTLFSQSNVGLLINPEKAKFVYLAYMDVHSVIGDRRISISQYEDPIIDRINCGEEGYKDSALTIVPIQRSKVDNETLAMFFKNEFMKGYKKHTMFGASSGVIPYNEIGINFPKEAVEAVILHSHSESEFNIGYAQSQGKNNEISGVMLANLFIEDVQQKSGRKLPLIHYNLTLSDKANFNEVEIDNKKVAKVLNDDPNTRAHYERLLGQQRVQNMIFGKGNWGIK